MEDYRLEQTGQEVQRILNGAAMDANLQAEVERATDAEGTLQDNIDAEEQARQDADSLLQQGIDDEAQRAKDAEEANAGEIEGIKALIPSTATPANKLADTNYVNSSIQTATAEYRGDYNVVTDLHLAIDATHAQIETLLPTVIAEADKNDYCYVMIPTSAQTPTEIAKIERYKMTSEGWKFEYDVNNSTFTAEEWAAIKSGITSGLVAKLNALPTNADLLLLLAGKQDVLTFDSVPVPESNNPVKSGGVYSAIDDEKTARLNSDTAIHAELDGLQAKVPATASSDNKLVDQNQMNSSISTATATYRGDWNVVSDLHLAVDATRAQIAALLPTVISTADNNDYCYVEIPTSAETPTQIERVERYKFNGTAWAYEYTLNNSGFTAAQWAAINSMITSGLVAKLSALPTNADLLAMLAQKQDNLTFDTTPTENSTNPVTSGGVFAADKALSDAIEAILLLIPSAASALNKLVDTSLMNSSISTATATFRGTYNLVSDLGLGIDATEGQIAAALLSAISTADNNDYSFVQIPTSAETPAQIARTDRYKFNGTAWAFEYTLNTSGFTAAQWAAINSTITSALVAKLNALPTAAELQEALGVLTSGITAINQKIPSTASQSNKLVDASTMESYIAQVINILDASFNVTSTDGHITLHITQVDGVITSVQVQSTDIASAAALTLITNRVTTAEGNISANAAAIANLQQLYNNLQQSKPVPVISLPTTGQQQSVIYRLAGSSSYSDYMWDGSSWVLMATYNNAIDSKPMPQSSNLVESGSLMRSNNQFESLDYSTVDVTPDSYWDASNGVLTYGSSGLGVKRTVKIPVFIGSRITASMNIGTAQVATGFVCDKNDNVLQTIPKSQASSVNLVITQNNADFICFNYHDSFSLTIEGVAKRITPDYINYGGITSCVFARRTNLSLQKVISGYIDFNDGTIHESSLSAYLSFKAFKGETIHLDANVGQGIAAISTSADGVTITPRVKNAINATFYEYTLQDDAYVFICCNNPSNDPTSYLQVYTKSNDNKFINYKGNGTFGYVQFSTGEIASSEISKYLIFDLKKYEAIIVNVLNIAGVAALAKQVNGGSIVPIVNSTGALDKYSYYATEDCKIYVSYRSDNPCLVNIHVPFTDIKEVNEGIPVFTGNVAKEYYQCRQTNYNAFPSKESTLTAHVYGLYDALVNNVHFSKETIGSASDGQALYAYKYTPYRLSNTPETYELKKYPLIFVIAGQHGFEKGNVFGLYYFIKDLLENYEEDPVLSYLHSCVEIRIVPVANPSGFDTNSYLNSNGVNLNRNWPVIDWESTGEPGDMQYGGVTPLDQPETAAIEAYYQTFKNNCMIVIDSHSQGSSNVDATNNINWIALNSIKQNYTMNFVYATLSHVEMITEHFLNEYASVIPNKGVCCRVTYGENPASLIYGNADVHFMQYGNFGLTLEGFCGFPTGEVFSADVQKGNAEIIGNYIMSVLRFY